MTDKSKKPVILAYGFEQVEFEVPPRPIVTSEFEIHFLDLAESLEDVENVDGIVIPSGAFEKIGSRNSISGPIYSVSRDLNQLLDRERQVRNCLKNGRWICFLVGDIIDHLSNPYGHVDASDTDLCKRLLNDYQILRTRTGGLTSLRAKANEFHRFTSKYGVARTILETYGNRVVVPLVLSGSHVVGLELLSRLFFLPFHTTDFTAESLEDALRMTVTGIREYRKKNEVSLPPWLEEFQFEEERIVRGRIDDLNRDLTKSTQELEVLRRYKGILTNSGSALVSEVKAILSNYFGLKVDDIDEGREDLRVVGDGGKILALLEIKGVNAGVKREHINQVDSHRERLVVGSDVPGVLIVNNNMSQEGFRKRKDTYVADEHILHAVRMNVTVMRSIDLLFYMKQLETRTRDDRGKALLELISGGGGWVRCSETGAERIVEALRK